VLLLLLAIAFPPFSRAPATLHATPPRELPPDAHPLASELFGRALRHGVGAPCEDLSASHRVEHDVLAQFPGGLKAREELGALLDAATRARGGGVGAELGVQSGNFARSLLSGWASASEYFFVDPWAHQKDYVDAANVPQAEQDSRMAAAAAVGASFAPRVKVHLLRNFSTLAVHGIADCSLDFVYVDAVHDYEGALFDMVDWWPKLRRGGVLAGHDWVDMVQPPQLPGGTSSIFGVKTAAAHFALGVRRQMWVTGEAEWRSFYMVK